MENNAKQMAGDLLLLHPDDNIAVLKRPSKAGSSHGVAGLTITVKAALSMGHKVAVTPIAKGADVLKYGAPIGFATCDIRAGDHVHLHNLASRYTVVEDMENSDNG